MSRPGFRPRTWSWLPSRSRMQSGGEVSARKACRRRRHRTTRSTAGRFPQATISCGTMSPNPSKKSTIQKSARIWKPWPLEDPLLSKKQSDSSNKTSQKTHFNELTHILSDPKCSPSKWWQVASDLCGLKGSASTCLPPLMDRCGKIVSESNAKADLLNEVFYKPEHLPCPGCLRLWTIASQCYFWLREHLSVGRSTCLTFIAQQDVMWERQDILSYDEGGWSRSGWLSC